MTFGASARAPEQHVEQHCRIALDALRATFPLAERQVVRRRQDPESSCMDEHLVYRTDATRKRRVDGDAERDRLPVHRPPGRDHEIGERDEAPRVDGALRDDEGREGEALDLARCSAVRGRTTACTA